MTTTAPNTMLNLLQFWAQPAEQRDEAFAWLRANEPVSWNDAPDPIAPDLPNEAGFWSLVKHDDIRYVSRTPELFTSRHGIFVDDFPQLETILSFIVMDAPRHTALRGIVGSTFTPRNVRQMDADIAATVREIISEVAPRGEGDLCALVTKEIPGRIFAGFMGIEDAEQRQDVMDAAEQLGSWADPEYAHLGSPLEVFVDAATRLQAVALEMAARRRSNPGDDLLSWIVKADYEGERMTEEELGAFFCLLAGAANDTTRHSTAHALITLQQHPEQRELLYADFDGRVDLAMNELLRWKPPLTHFRRVASQDIELRGKTIKAGDKVVMWYLSGCRDEEVFGDPFTFRIDRNPNPHQAFGGGGIHLCLGSALAKQMLKSALREVNDQLLDLQIGDPEYMLSNFMQGVMKLPATWRPRQSR
jgi:cytochrome P450